MAGRCLFFEHTLVIQQRIRSKLSYFDQAASGNIRTNVFILSGLCGGTGSGSFIDIAYLVKKTMREFGNSTPMLYGVFELPDSTIKHMLPGWSDRVTLWRMQNNGYAALQELDYFMKKQPDDGNPPYRFIYRGEPNVTIDETRVFSKVYLLSNDVKTGQGGFFSKNPEGFPPPFYYLDRAVPELVHTYITRPHFQNDEDEQNYHPFWLYDGGMPCPNIRAGNIYSTAGIAKLEVPVDQILACVANRFFYEIRLRWEVDPTAEEVKSLYDFTDVEGLRAELGTCLDEVIRDLSKEDLEIAEPYIRKIVKSRLMQKIKESNSNAAWINSLRGRMKALYMASGPFSMINLINRTCEEIDAYVNSLSFVPGNFGGELKDYKMAVFFIKGKVKKKLLSAIRRAMEGEKNVILKEFIKRRQYELVHNIEAYTPCTELIESLSDTFENITGIDTPAMRVSGSEGETFSRDFSKADYAAVSKKTAAMFRKIVVSSETVRNPHVSFEDLYRLEGTGRRKKYLIITRMTMGVWKLMS
jgi:hypothetical protein